LQTPGRHPHVERTTGAHTADAVPPRLAETGRPLAPGMQEEKNSLDEGEAVLIWPENLSADSVRDLEYWLQGVLRKAKRRAGVKDENAEKKQ
jgi:hypothetical protein